MHRVLIWDAEGDPPAGEWTTILWRAFAPAGGRDVVSMPSLVEERADDLRARYLAWVFDLANGRLGGTRVVEHLELRPGFSYWWMTALAHTPNYYESPHITDAIKCLAFEDLCRAIPGDHAAVRLCTRNGALHKVLKAYCRARGIEFHAESPDPAPLTPRRRRGLSRRAVRARALAATAARELGCLIRVRRSKPLRTPTALCFFDVLVYLKHDAIKNGTFRSDYWGDLTSVLEQSQASSTWIHIFYPQPEIRTLSEADALLERFNAASSRRACHALLDSRLGWRSLVTTLGSYARLAASATRLRGIAALFSPAGSAFNFWPFFKRNWYESLLGAPAIRNCLRLALYEAELKALPRQSTGLFIQENQPWEIALLYAWRAAGHGRIIGVPHTTVRFWDLRYFYDPRSYDRTDPHALPIPDVVAVNGPMAFDAHLQGGFPASRLFEVEALRFAHLTDARAATGERVRPGREDPAGRRVLICGDNIPGSNDKVMLIVERAARMLPPSTRYVFKPHKAGVFDPSKYPLLNVLVQDGHLVQMLQECDIAVTGNVTSAAADAYCLGRRVAVLADGDSLNGSPLRGMNGVRQFANPEELADIIGGRDPAPAPSAGPLFRLDPDLPRWRELLGLPAAHAPRRESPSTACKA